MAENPRTERRRFVRVDATLSVHYRFRSNLPAFTDYTLYHGKAGDIGCGGLLLTGAVPSVDWLTELLMHSVILELVIDLPGEPSAVRATAKVAWLDAVDQDTDACQLGLTFDEIPDASRQRILDFIVKHHAGGDQPA